MKTGNEELAKVLAAARQQLKASGDDEGPMSKLEKILGEVLENQKSDRTAITEMQEKISGGLSDQVVEGQQKLRSEVIRKGGFNTIDNVDMFARMVDTAGLTMEQKLIMPDYQLKKYVPSAQAYDRIKMFQTLNDDAMILGWILATKGQKGNDVNGVSMDRVLGNTRTWKGLQAVHKALTTSGVAGGTEWMPTQFSSQLVDILTVSLKVAANFSRIDIPSNVFKVPIATSDDIAFLVPETTNDNLLNETNIFPKLTPTTGNVSFNAIKLAAIIVFSEEAQEDSIIPLLDFVRMKIAHSMANAQERATLDGDKSATHQDFDVTAVTDCRKAWAGLRKNIISNSATTQSLATFNLDNVRLLRGLLTPAFAENPEALFYVCSVKGMLKLLKFPEFLTVDKYGPRATVVTGEIGRIDGSPLQTSKYCRDDVATTGVNTSAGPNASGLLYLQNNLGYWYGDRRALTIDSARMIISGQGYMVVSQRIDFEAIYPTGTTATTYKTGALGTGV